MLFPTRVYEQLTERLNIIIKCNRKLKYFDIVVLLSYRNNIPIYTLLCMVCFLNMYDVANVQIIFIHTNNVE